MSYKKERIKYIDTLKFLAIFAIITLHVFKLWPDAQILNFNISNLIEITRFGVPVFLMISGALLLNKEIEIDKFLKKRFIRILLPLIFYLCITVGLGIHKTPLTSFWYCWMIIGAYLTIPVINIFIKNAKMKEIEYFIALFVIAVVIYQLTMHFNIKHYLDLNFFIGPISLFILGYYLSKKDFKISPNKMVSICIITFIIAVILEMKFGIKGINIGTENLQTSLSISLLKIIESSSVFLILRYLYESKTGIYSKIRKVLETKTVNKFILSVSRASYGMFFFHIVLLKGFFKSYLKGLNLTGTGVCITILLTSIILFIVSWLGVLLLGQIPYIKKLSGYY